MNRSFLPAIVALLLFSQTLYAQVTPTANWQLQDASKVPQPGAAIAQPGFSTNGWYPAVVPGTVLTTLVHNNVYPEPLYGENNRPDRIPESLCRTNWWYRTEIKIPSSYKNKNSWLHFNGINYTARVWVNGKDIGEIRGAFARGIFDITSAVKPGETAAIAVLVSPQPNPGEPHEHTIAQGMGKNGGITAMDGPTFLCSMGWDWIPAIRDRNTGIWQSVYLNATGPVLVKDPLVTTDLPLPALNTADVKIAATVQNITGQPQQGILKGAFGNVAFSEPVQLPPHSSKRITFDPATLPQLKVKQPKLWWPNGYGPQNLYTLQLQFNIQDKVSDEQQLDFGIREISYTTPSSEDLTISVNGVKVFCKGGNWGMDEAMKRIPKERLETQIRMHQQAHYNIIRNWVGQSTSEDLYALCDKYGLMIWDEFFQPNPSDGPNPADINLYLANVREKILRFRNHPSIILWCARNEGNPPKVIDDSLRNIMAELEPLRLYQPSSTSGRGVHSGGPYYTRKPAEYYIFTESFKTEIGSFSIPTLESVQGMMPQQDWEVINDDWAEHDLATKYYRNMIAKRFGEVANLADFVRKSQLANYESYRAMYEGRNAKMFNPSTGVITWMSNPAQPSFVWQLYHHDLEPNAALFAVQKACEPIHIQLNEKEGNIQVINNRPATLKNARAHLTIFNTDGTAVLQQDYNVTALPAVATDLGLVKWPADLSPVHFVKVTLHDANGTLLSDNFYWNTLPLGSDQLTGLEKIPVVTLTATVKRHQVQNNCMLEVSLHNPSTHIAVMAHLQLHRQGGDRVLPVFYSDNYVSLCPNETKTITIEASEAALQGSKPLILVDGFNVNIKAHNDPDAAIALNENAQVSHWPITHLPRPDSTTQKN
ncbi:beta-mannosidase [Chitinophaga ginsengisegetis]|uniref:Beta-mannosidase n=1 Tax=Chitinophaga ginsengisegetis TaxID=393003 RepID=A0A1T5P917_9BACT|nr:sugar-binding domain-containing protein [Chitinophaga ginsengisegetis]SKD09073.1 beta-mannosidase [Chitinophaga ginsengisegetis]